MAALQRQGRWSGVRGERLMAAAGSESGNCHAEMSLMPNLASDRGHPPVGLLPLPRVSKVCADFGVKQIARGRAGHARLSSPGPLVGGRKQNPLPPRPIWRHFPQTLKKAAKAPRKPRSECTPEEIAKLNAESAKRMSRRAVVKVNAAAAKFAAERDAMEAARRKAEYMEDVIFEGGQGRAYDPDETQSQDGRAQYVPDEEADDRADYDHGDSWHEDDDIYCEGDGDEEEGNDVDISGEPLFIDELTQRAEAQKRRKSICTAFQSLEAFKARHNDKPFTLTPCWTIINNCPKFKDQYHELQRKRGMKTAKFAGGGDGEACKRPRGKTNSKVDDIRDASSMALHDTLHDMISQKDVRDEKKRQSKDEQMKQYLDLQRKKLEMEEAAKRRKIDMEEAARQRQLDIEADNVKARQRQLDIEATNTATKAKEVALAIMSVDLSKMSEKTRAWFEASQKEMLDADGLN
ncbi:uncharacterized protein [Aegilops tauschii subsp. strangulata]|uniref:uncharacterized protein n=1 Tax=Aegilops tauschii subsp. strangulata TaxID=200361 RepID=UPI003CC84158